MKIATNDVFTYDGVEMQVLVNGINIQERFLENPMMLSEHNYENVIGKWDLKEITDSYIEAEPIFIEGDALSENIKLKYDKGFINYASIRIEPVKGTQYMNGNVLVIPQSILLEASLVGIPANKKAKKNMAFSICLSEDGQNIDVQELIKNINPPMEEIITPEEIVEEVITVEEEVIIPEEEIVEEPAIDFETEFNNLKLEIASKDATISILTDKLDKLELSYKSVMTEKMNDLLNSAEKAGKITKEFREECITLSYDKVRSMIDKLPTPSLSLSAVVNSEMIERRNGIKNFAWYLKNDKPGLTKLSKDAPETYKQLEKEYLENFKINNK